MKLRKCPKCRSINLGFSQQMTSKYLFVQTDSGVSYAGSRMTDRTAVPGVYGLCRSCKHTWKLRGISEMWEIITDPEGE